MKLKIFDPNTASHLIRQQKNSTENSMVVFKDSHTTDISKGFIVQLALIWFFGSMTHNMYI